MQASLDLESLQQDSVIGQKKGRQNGKSARTRNVFHSRNGPITNLSQIRLHSTSRTSTEKITAAALKDGVVFTFSLLTVFQHEKMKIYFEILNVCSLKNAKWRQMVEIRILAGLLSLLRKLNNLHITGYFCLILSSTYARQTTPILSKIVTCKKVVTKLELQWVSGIFATSHSTN